MIMKNYNNTAESHLMQAYNQRQREHRQDDSNIISAKTDGELVRRMQQTKRDLIKE